MATTAQQRRIQASLNEVNQLLKEKHYPVSAAKKSPSILEQLAEGEGLMDILGQRAASKAGDWLESKLPKSVRDYLGHVEEDDEDEDEDEEEVSEEDIVEEVESELEKHSKSLDEVLAKFKKEPGPKHIDDLVKVLTDYTKAHNANAKKVEEEKKAKEKKSEIQKHVFKPFSEKFD
jgi:hypothetical protein